jgi:O-acetylhomoserine (thiol)-lyase
MVARITCSTTHCRGSASPRPFVDPRDIDAWRAAILPSTRLLFGETLGNPGLDVLDIPRVAELAHDQGLPLMVDSTFTTPYLMQPFSLGADIVYHSATKFLSGHGVVIGGLLVDSGRFDWASPSGKRQVSDTDRALFGVPQHGIRRGIDDRGIPASRATRRRPRLRCLHGAFRGVPDPAGIETLPLRMARHVENTRAIVAFLSTHPLVDSIGYPELPQHPDHALAAKLLPRGCGAVFSFNLRGTRAQGRQFIEALRIFSHLANVGDAKSLVIHPASTTHFRMSAEDMIEAGITEGTIRLSVGLENPDDLIEDLSRALYAAGKA